MIPSRKMQGTNWKYESENQDANETDGEKIDNDAMSVATKRIDETVNSETDVDDSEKTEMRAIDGTKLYESEFTDDCLTAPQLLKYPILDFWLS